MLSMPADLIGKLVPAGSTQHSQMPASRSSSREQVNAPGLHPLHLRVQLERRSPPVQPEEDAESESSPEQIVNTLQMQT